MKITTLSKDRETYHFSIKLKNGEIEIITDLVKTEYCLILHELHIDGLGKGMSSISELKKAAIELGKQFDVKEVVIFGGRRTTGASVGKAAKNSKGQIKQKPLVFKVK